MKFAVVCLIAIGIIGSIYVSARPEEYTHKFDNINVDEILNNNRLFNRYVDCLLDKPVKCPPGAVELKNVLSEALETECAKCSDRQKDTVKRVVRYLILNKPQRWKDLKAKYDPDGKYTKKYEDLAKEEGVQL